METTFFSKELGGALDYNVIPNLYKLAGDNVNFSRSDGPGGCQCIPGAAWTMGGLVAQTSGIPLNLPKSINGNDYGKYNSILPGATTIMDILHKEGYYQSFMCGSDGDFGGRRKFFMQHGLDDVFDVKTIAEDGLVEKGYDDGWWGFEDQLLYKYAETKLPVIASKEQPFAFFMITADTHHPNGNLRECCPSDFLNRYENVYACADNQIALFLDWLSKQDFYGDTVVVISGDHLSMDNAYMTSNVDPNYTRNIYNCFINSAVEPVREKHREFTTVDMFPTTLAAMGCRIEGDRLGLGVNLFSGEETLAEKYGYEKFSDMSSQKSAIYDRKFLLGENS